MKYTHTQTIIGNCRSRTT